MMTMLARYSPIGLDIGSRCVHAVQLRTSRRGPAAHAWASIPRPGLGGELGPQEAQRIAATLDRMGFVGREVAASLPEGKVVSASLELPPRSSGAPLDTIARQELARAAKCEATELEICWWELPGAGRAGEATHAMAVGGKHTDSLALITGLADVGLEVVRIDTPATALARVAASLAEASPALTAVVDMGWSSAQVLVLQGSMLVYQRAVGELGLRRLCDQIASATGLDPDQSELALRDLGCASGSDTDWPGAGEIRSACGALADEIAEQVRLSLAYAQRRFDGVPTQVLALGGGANLPGVVDRLASRSEVRLAVLRGDGLVLPGKGLGSELASLSVGALSLALGHLPPRAKGAAA